MNTKKLIQAITFIGLLSLILVPMMGVGAQYWGNNVNEELSNFMGKEDPQVMIAKVIKIVISFLGIIAVVIILIGGFKWMTAGGNDEKVTEARKLIIAGVTGLVIILAAWGIATFVLNQLINVTNAPAT